jgi:hypothetical protein
MNEEMSEGQKMIWAAAFIEAYGRTHDISAAIYWAGEVLDRLEKAALDIGPNPFFKAEVQAYRRVCDMLGEEPLRIRQETESECKKKE